MAKKETTVAIALYREDQHVYVAQYPQQVCCVVNVFQPKDFAICLLSLLPPGSSTAQKKTFLQNTVEHLKKRDVDVMKFCTYEVAVIMNNGQLSGNLIVCESDICPLYLVN